MSKLNIDPLEVAKFSDLAFQWWDPRGDFKTLHEINPLRLQYIEERTALSTKRFIDIGCGGGILAESLAKKGALVTGIDMSQSAINTAKLHLHESGLQVDYKLKTAEAMAAQHPGEFDTVVCMEMLEHVPDPLSIIAACAKLVKPNGDLFFSTLNRNVKAYLFAIIGAEYLLKLLPKNTHDYAKFIRPCELAEWARKSGLKLMDMKGISYHLLTKQYSLTEDISVNYLAHFKKH